MDRVILKERAVIDSINDALKNICYRERSRYRSFDNFVGNLVAGLTAYSFLDSKPSVKIQRLLPALKVA